MNQQIQVKPVDITRGEKVYYGYYAALETIFRQFISEMESYFLDEFNLSFQFEFEITGGIKFRDYLGQLAQPSPIFCVGLSPLSGDSLFVLENRCANLLLSKSRLQQRGKVILNNQFQVNGENYEVLHNAADRMLNLFTKSWGILLPAEQKLKKLVSHRFKAKVMNPLESCVAVKIIMKHKQLTTFCEFCFSAYQLDPILKKYGKKTLLRGDGLSSQKRDIQEYFSYLITEEAQYEVRGVVGDMTISRNQLIESFREGKIIPLENVLKNNVVVQFNGVPLLSANAGVTLEHFSLQINGKYEVVEEEIKQQQRPFAKLQFPNSTPD